MSTSSSLPWLCLQDCAPSVLLHRVNFTYEQHHQHDTASLSDILPQMHLQSSLLQRPCELAGRSMQDLLYLEATVLGPAAVPKLRASLLLK